MNWMFWRRSHKVPADYRQRVVESEAWRKTLATLREHFDNHLTLERDLLRIKGILAEAKTRKGGTEMKKAMAMVAVVGLAAVLGAGCTTLGSKSLSPEEALALAKNVPQAQALLDKYAAKVGYSQTTAMPPLVRDVYVDNSGKELTNGVRRVQTYQSVQELVPAAGGPTVTAPALPPVVVPANTNSIGSLLP